MELHLALKIFFSLALLYIFSLFIRLVKDLFLEPEKLRSKLRKQGITGPQPSFLYGNIPQIQKILSTAPKKEHSLTHTYFTKLFPYFEQWSKEYGKVFTFSLGNVQLLYLTDPHVVKEMILCTSIDLGKPAYQQKERGALLGQGILTANGSLWAHQRKVIAPEFYMERVKGMADLMVEAFTELIELWERKIDKEGGLADIKADADLRTFSSILISKVLFGKDYEKATKIFLRFRGIQEFLNKPSLLSGMAILRYLPTKSNRELWRLEKEVYSMILSIVKERKDDSCDKDLLQSIIEGAKDGDLSPEEIEQFIIDNCKNLYLAGYETTAISTSWALMLMASKPEWQDRARAEVLEICGGNAPDVDMIRKMKTLTNVIQESLRLYPTASLMTREALKDLKFGGINIPKGVNLWISVLPFHNDPELWGPDAHEFNPGRFANGLNSACKFPHAYMPFGVGPRICAGQNFAMVELKIVLALILSKFSFTLSPKYQHSPFFRLNVEPQFGIDLIIKRL